MAVRLGPGHLLHPGDTLVHRLPADVKLLATVGFAVAVVLTPPEAMWAFAVDAVAVAAVAGVARIPAGLVLRRMRIEIPFLAFAVFLPLLGGPPSTRVAGLTLSEPGLWAAWNIAAKATLGVLAAIVLSATTPVPALLAGLERLRAPRTLVAITGFMVRYLDVIVGEADRTRIARLARGGDPRWLWQARGIATTAGHLFVRSYERGERVHLAMRSRGFTGSLPELSRHGPAGAERLLAAVLPAIAVTALAGALLW